MDNTLKSLAIISLCGTILVPCQVTAEEPAPLVRDAVGDLNAPSVKAGDFPGALKLPGLENISLAIGGFVKTVAIGDSNAESIGVDLLPATLGTGGSDQHGQFSIDSSLTRFFVDGRAPVPNGKVRAYIEYDLNANNNGSSAIKIRHAYGRWYAEEGILTAGQT